MRIKVLHRPTLLSVDGVRLDRFEPGNLYDVGTALGCLFLCEGWAEPVADDTPALLVPLTAQTADREPDPANLSREMHPPAGEKRAPRALAAHLTRRTRSTRQN